MKSKTTSERSSFDLPDDVAIALDNVVERLSGGESVDVESLCRRFPDSAARIRKIFPAIAAMAEFGNWPTDADSADGNSRPLRHGLLGDFRIVQEIGRGGMGIVYEAEQVSLSRRVAVKILPFASLLDQRQLERFRNEARAAAMLKHTNIVSVYQVGYERGLHYYAMELVDGQSLADVTHLLGNDSEQRPGDTRNRSADTVAAAALSTQRTSDPKRFYQTVARLGIQAAEALHYAHEEGIVHRDIKPSNLLLDNQGKLWITDFGLAQIQGSNDLTITGDLVGTLRYMSPEQAQGKPLDGCTDIFSLGLVLYELLTLEPAFSARNRHELLHQIHEREPSAPRRANPLIPSDLETIVLKAIAKQPGDRYESCLSLAADLRRFVEHKPIRARRSTAWEKSARWVRRNPVVSTLAISIGVLLSCLAIGAALTATKQVALAKKTQMALSEAKIHNYALSVAGAYEAFDNGDIARTKQLLSMHMSNPALAATPPFELLYLWNQCQNVVKTPGISSISATGPTVLSPSGRHLVAADSDGEIRFWDVRTLNLARTVSMDVAGDISAIAISHSGWIAVGTSEGVIQLLHGEGLQEQTILHRHPRTIRDMVFSPDESHLAYADDSSVVRLCQLAKEGGESTTSVIDDFHGNTLASISFSPDGRLLVASGGWASGTARVWNVSDRRLIATLPVSPELHTLVVTAFSPDGKSLVTAGKQLMVWNTSDWTMLERFELDNRSTGAVSVSPDGRIIAAADKGRIRLFDMITRRELNAIQAHTGRITYVGFSADACSLISSTETGKTRIWPEKRWKDQIPNDTVPTSSVGVCFTGPRWNSPLCVATGQGFFAGKEFGQVSLLNLTTGKWTVLDEFSSPLLAVASSPTTPHVVAVARKLVNETWGITIWDTMRQKVLTTLPGRRAAIYCMEFSPDGKLLASADFALGEQSPNEELNGVELRLVIWDLDRGSMRHSVETPNICGLSFSPDGQHLAVTGGAKQDRRKVRFLDVRTGTWESVEFVCDGELLPVQYSPDGRRLACGDYSGRLYVWDVSQKRNVVVGPMGNVLPCLAFSPDGQTIATGSSDATVQLWHAATGSRLASLKTKRTPASIVFSQEGTALVAGCADGSVMTWHIDGYRTTYTVPTRQTHHSPKEPL